MMNNEYCRYIHTYSELEGLQHAHSLVYCGALSAQGVVMELRHEQDGRVRCSAVRLPEGSFARAMQLLPLPVRKQRGSGAVAGGAGGRGPEL